MMGYGALGELALGELRVAGAVSVRATGGGRARGRSATTAVASVQATARGTAQMRAPGGWLAGARAQGSARAVPRPTSAVSAHAMGSARGPSIGFVVRPVPAPKQPLFLTVDDTVPSSWPGRSS